MSYPYRVIAEHLINTRTNDPITHDHLRALIATLRYPENPLERATTLEDVARATLAVFVAQHSMLTTAQRRVFDTAWCIARPFDNGEARLIICSSTRVLYNAVLPTSGSLHDWASVVQIIWDMCALTIWMDFGPMAFTG